MPTARFPHLSCGICFEGIQNWFWFAISRDHSVNVIGSCIECQEDPTPDLTSLLDSLLDSRSALRAKLHRWLLERSQIVSSPLLVGRNARSLIAIMKTIYRPSCVAMKPTAVSSKGDEVSKRNILSSKLTVSVSHVCLFSVRI